MRGDLYRLPAPHGARGHEQQGPRYGVVIQSDHLPLSTVLVAPTSRSAMPASFRPVIEVDGTQTRVLPEQARAIDEQRLGRFVGRLTGAEIAELDRALLDVLDLRR